MSCVLCLRWVAVLCLRWAADLCLRWAADLCLRWDFLRLNSALKILPATILSSTHNFQSKLSVATLVWLEGIALPKCITWLLSSTLAVFSLTVWDFSEEWEAITALTSLNNSITNSHHWFPPSSLCDHWFPPSNLCVRLGGPLESRAVCVPTYFSHVRE